MDKMTQEAIARRIVEKLGLRRAREASLPHNPPIPNPLGFEGVDLLPGRNPRYRARIRFCDALSGNDVRVTLGTKFDNAEEANFAYGMAHIRVYGAVSRYSGSVSTDILEFLLRR